MSGPIDAGDFDYYDPEYLAWCAERAAADVAEHGPGGYWGLIHLRPPGSFWGHVCKLDQGAGRNTFLPFEDGGRLSAPRRPKPFPDRFCPDCRRIYEEAAAGGK